MIVENMFAILVFPICLSALLTWALCRRGFRWQILDVPNERSLHENATPRSGGLAIVFTALASLALFGRWDNYNDCVMWFGVAVITTATISFIDDLRGVPFIYRLLVHFLSAAMVIAVGLEASVISYPGGELVIPGMLGVVLTLFFVVWMINLYNFMDGMDGFAGGMGVIGFSTLGLIGHMAGNDHYSAVALTVAASVGGFLLFNFPPARIFMGDVGSSTLGLLAATLILWGTSKDIFPVWTGIIIFSPFIIDSTITLIKRVVTGKRIWQAHRTHYYQRLVRCGLGHRRTVLWEYALMLVCAIAAIWSLDKPSASQWLVIIGLGFVYLAASLVVGMLERQSHT